jgi:hypothetical protein
MGQRSTRRGKPHCEAFPALDNLQAERSQRAGGGVCEWRNEQGRAVGRGCMLELDQVQAVFSYDFPESTDTDRASGTLSAEISSTRRNPHLVRKILACPECQRHAQKMFYVTGIGACRSCYQLAYSKQRLEYLNKNINGRDELLAELQRLPPGGQHTRWCNNQQRHLGLFNRELAAEGFTAPPRSCSYARISASFHQATLRSRRTSIGREWELGRRMMRLGAAIQLAWPSSNLSYLHGTLRPCELIGSEILDRPFQPFLTRHRPIMRIACQRT